MRLPALKFAVALAVLLGPLDSPMSATSTAGLPTAEYRVAVGLAPASRILTGTGTIRWHNATSRPVAELRFLMPWNGRRHERTTWARERRVQGRRVALGGSMDLSHLAIVTPSGTRDLTPRLRAVSPDDGNPEDRTVWAVALDTPVPPRSTVDLEMAWTARVPDLADGLGTFGAFYLVADWLPRIAILGEDGWHAHQAHAGLPPSAPDDAFTVNLRLPSAWRVAATGESVATEDHADGTTTHRFEASATSFAWVAGARLVERTQKIEDASTWPVTVRVLAQPEHASQIDRLITASRITLANHHRWLTLETYDDSLTIVDVPEAEWQALPDASDAWVASYPGIVAVHTPWVTPWSSIEPEHAVLAGVTAQYWGSATDEHAWMNLGLTNYLAARIARTDLRSRFIRVERYFQGLVAWPYADVRWGPRERRGRLALDAGRPAAAAGPAWNQPARLREVNLDERVPLAFETFERMFGWETLQNALGRYWSQRGPSPAPEDLMAVTNASANRDVAWFFDRTVRSGARFDYAVRSVESRATPDGVKSSVVVARLADGRLPVEILVTFDDGSSLVERWDNAEDSTTFTYERASPVATVAIDPNHRLALEVNRVNNSWTSRPAARLAAGRWTVRWAAWFQHVLLTYAAFV
jgi:hypothetical protein